VDRRNQQLCATSGRTGRGRRSIAEASLTTTWAHPTHPVASMRPRTSRSQKRVTFHWPFSPSTLRLQRGHNHRDRRNPPAATAPGRVSSSLQRGRCQFSRSQNRPFPGGHTVQRVTASTRPRSSRSQKRAASLAAARSDREASTRPRSSRSQKRRRPQVLRCARFPGTNASRCALPFGRMPMRLTGEPANSFIGRYFDDASGSRVLRII
jgi:hypothetical protein